VKRQQENGQPDAEAAEVTQKPQKRQEDDGRENKILFFLP
jgi:hypothetical protein